MGNLDFSANADQLKELATYMASQINVPTIGIGGGYAPIGAIIPLMGTTAPQDYLACDGTVYNIADYPQLADYFESQFGESNHFGGNGTTTFAVPDLQGEFLRGSGTNSHANQGSGANVGEHQDGTQHLYNRSASGYLYIGDAVNFDNADKSYNSGTGRGMIQGTYESSSNTSVYTSRPTNTSVLYCIKAVVAGEVYSTEERVVGTWIDGKPLYQKVMTEVITTVDVDTYFDIGASIDFARVQSMLLDNNGYVPMYNATNSFTQYIKSLVTTNNHATQKNKLLLRTTRNEWLNKPIISIIQYTKTT